MAHTSDQCQLYRKPWRILPDSYHVLVTLLFTMEHDFGIIAMLFRILVKCGLLWLKMKIELCSWHISFFYSTLYKGKRRVDPKNPISSPDSNSRMVTCQNYSVKSSPSWCHRGCISKWKKQNGNIMLKKFSDIDYLLCSFLFWAPIELFHRQLSLPTTEKRTYCKAIICLQNRCDAIKVWFSLDYCLKQREAENVSAET